MPISSHYSILVGRINPRAVITLLSAASRIRSNRTRTTLILINLGTCVCFLGSLCGFPHLALPLIIIPHLHTQCYAPNSPSSRAVVVPPPGVFPSTPPSVFFSACQCCFWHAYWCNSTLRVQRTRLEHLLWRSFLWAVWRE
jgi:hypothetical protein